MTSLVARAPCPADAPLRVAVLASGSGTNLQALLDHRDGFEIVAVLCNRPQAKALERAEKAGVPALVVDHKAFAGRAEFEREVLHTLAPHKPEVIVLAGFMRVLTEVFLDGVGAPVVNVHPALLPAFPGMHGARQALAHGARVAGCTVHLVDSGVDTGPILAQAAVNILDDDDEDALQARIQVEEHRLLPRTITAIARGDVIEKNDKPFFRRLFS
jgi:phosphoribosylglycinamide formyltransferase-1